MILDVLPPTWTDAGHLIETIHRRERAKLDDFRRPLGTDVDDLLQILRTRVTIATL